MNVFTVIMANYSCKEIIKLVLGLAGYSYSTQSKAGRRAREAGVARAPQL